MEPIGNSQRPVELPRSYRIQLRENFKDACRKALSLMCTPVRLIGGIHKSSSESVIRPAYSIYKRLLFVAIILGIFGVGSTYKLAASSEHFNTTRTPSVQAQTVPKKVTPTGPAQTNSLFSTYPTWAQDFATDTSGTLDGKYWEINQGPPQNSNHEAEYYTGSPTNLRIANGALILEATQQPEPQNYDYASARIDTDGKISFLYGRVDIVAKLPDSAGTWPAAWFLPANNKYEDLSPSSDTIRYLNGGEIDLIEEVGSQPNTEYGIVHSLSDLNNPGGVGDYNQIKVPNNDNAYNTYTMLWTPTSITFELNNNPFYTYSRPVGANYTNWPFDQPFYLILNLAMGGSWGGEDTAQFPGNGIDNSALPATMSIQSIYYYPYTGSN
jgi:beta-glucanase (GH16 family)